jgi:sporulation protein YlmC with PRC-barrel domain
MAGETPAMQPLSEEVMSYSASSDSSHLADKETTSLIAASKVNGTRVYDTAGESLGSIHDVMLDKRSGQVKYAVLSFGGFLGMGEKYHPLPWDQLTYSEQHGGYVVNLDRDRLEGAPVYAASETPDWSSPSYPGSIDDYYASTITSRA